MRVLRVIDLMLEISEGEVKEVIYIILSEYYINYLKLDNTSSEEVLIKITSLYEIYRQYEKFFYYLRDLEYDRELDNLYPNLFLVFKDKLMPVLLNMNNKEVEVFNKEKDSNPFYDLELSYQLGLRILNNSEFTAKQTLAMCIFHLVYSLTLVKEKKEELEKIFQS